MCVVFWWKSHLVPGSGIRLSYKYKYKFISVKKIHEVIRYYFIECMQVPDYKSSFSTSGGGREGVPDNSQSVYELNTKREWTGGVCKY